MTPDILALLTQLGIPGQVIAYIAMAISIATIMLRYLPRPAGTGWYGVTWRVLSRIANLKAPDAPAGAPAAVPTAIPPVAALLVAALIGLTACAGSTAGSINAQAEQLAIDANLVASGLSALLPDVAKMANVPPATLATLQADVALIQTDAAAVQKAVAANTPSSAATNVQEIGKIVGDIAFVVLPAIPGGAAFVPLVGAAQTLLPSLLAAVGLPAPVAGTPDDLAVARARFLLATAAAHG